MKKKLAAMLVGGISVLALSGCGMTTEKLIDEMKKQEVNSASTESSLDVDVSLGASGMSIDFAFGGDMSMDFTFDGDESNIYLVTDLTMDLFGQKTPVETEMYIINDGDEVATYQLQEDDVWTVNRTEVEDTNIDEDMINDIRDAYFDVLKNAELQKKTETVGKEECYVLVLNTGLDAFEDVLKIVYDAQEDTADEAMEEAGMDWDDMMDVLSAINMDLTMYVSKKDNTCRKIIVDLSGTDTAALIEKILDASSNADDMADNMGVDPDDVEIEINALSFEITFSDLNDMEVALPGDVEDDAVESGSYYGGGDPVYVEPDPIEVDPEPIEIDPEPAVSTGNNNGVVDFDSDDWNEATVDAWVEQNGGQFAICDWYDESKVIAYANLLTGFHWWVEYCDRDTADMLPDEDAHYIDIEINVGLPYSVQDMMLSGMDYYEGEPSEWLKSDVYSLISTVDVSQGTVYIVENAYEYADLEGVMKSYYFILVTGDLDDNESVYFSLSESTVEDLESYYYDNVEDFLHALFD